MIRLLTDHWKYKVGSVALAGLLWLGTVEESELATTLLASVQYKNVPKDLEMSSDLPDKVHLEVSGPASKLSPAVLADTRILLDLGIVKRPGVRTFPIDQVNVVLPSGVVLERASPSQVRLSFEPRLSKMVKVKLRVRQQPTDGFEIVSQSISPPELAVVGPASRVQQIDSVETDSIDLDHLGNAAEVFTVHAYLADPQVRFAADGKVKIRVEVKKTATQEP